MSLESKYNLKSPGVKRLMREACELAEPTEEYFACPLDDNLFEWHFTIRGPPSTEFEGGYYHGRIMLPSQYPMEPPNIILLTPNGRFEVNKKICLSISGHHPECWQPSWSIRTALLALIAFMPTPAAGSVGSLDYPPEERKALARKSRNWRCTNCGRIADCLSSGPAPQLTIEEKSLVGQINFKGEDEIPKPSENCQNDVRTTSIAGAPSVPSVESMFAPPNELIVEAEVIINRRSLEKSANVFIVFLVFSIVFLMVRRIFFQ